jgi:branched-chain amino acid aminotransferase
MDALIAIDGRVTRPDDARMSPLDRGFLIGDAVFEVFVAFGSHVMDLQRHLTRLRCSADMIGLEIPWSDAEMAFELTSLAEQVSHLKKYLRLVVTRGQGLGVRIPDRCQPSRVTYCFKAEMSTLRPGQGLAMKRLVRPGFQRGSAAKTPHYLPAAVGLARAAREGFDEILWSSPEGEVAEAHAANIFFMAREGDYVSFVTPPEQSGLLLGVTRETVITLLRNAGIPVAEEVIFIDELPRFDEAFLCSTVQGLVPIRRIDNFKLHTLRQQATFWHIERLFQTWVSTQLGYRVDWQTGAPLLER